MRDGTAVERSRETLGDYLARWLDTVRPPQMTESSHDTAVMHCRAYLVPQLGQVPIQALDCTTVKGAYARLRVEGGRGGKPLADSTVHRIHTTLRRALGDAVDDQVIRTNPAAGAHTAPSHAEQDEVAAWTADELARFLTRADEHEPRWAHVWHLVAHSGMRRGEVAQLAWRAVDLGAATVTVAKAKTVRGRRTIDLDLGTVAVLRENSTPSNSAAGACSADSARSTRDAWSSRSAGASSTASAMSRKSARSR